LIQPPPPPPIKSTRDWLLVYCKGGKIEFLPTSLFLWSKEFPKKCEDPVAIDTIPEWEMSEHYRKVRAVWEDKTLPKKERKRLIYTLNRMFYDRWRTEAEKKLPMGKPLSEILDEMEQWERYKRFKRLPLREEWRADLVKYINFKHPELYEKVRETKGRAGWDVFVDCVVDYTYVRFPATRVPVDEAVKKCLKEIGVSS